MLKLPHVHIRQETMKQLIFSTVRIGGPIAAALLGIRAGKKIQQAKVEMLYLEDPDDPDPQENGLYFEDLTRSEQFKIIAPKFIPPLAAAGLTVAVACIDKRTDIKRIAEMTGLYSTALASAEVYRKKLAGIDQNAAEEADKEIGVQQLEAAKADGKDVVERARGVNNPNKIFIDTLSGREFLSTLDDVNNAIEEYKGQYVESEMIDDMAANENPDGKMPSKSRYVALNNFYDMLGIKDSYYGQEFGFVGIKDRWSEGGWKYSGAELNIYLVHADDPNVYYIEYEQKPIEGWYAL